MNSPKRSGRGDWGEIKIKKGRLRVQQVTEGSENRLRHFLESVVLQANTTTGATEPESDEDDGDAAETDERDGPDAELTERFRAFGAEAED